jgi:hypothetical protein
VVRLGIRVVDVPEYDLFDSQRITSYVVERAKIHFRWKSYT